MRHSLIVRYTTDDDGIWVWCEDCGYQKNLGFLPSVVLLLQEQREHLRKGEG